MFQPLYLLYHVKCLINIPHHISAMPLTIETQLTTPKSIKGNGDTIVTRDLDPSKTLAARLALLILVALKKFWSSTSFREYLSTQHRSSFRRASFERSSTETTSHNSRRVSAINRRSIDIPASVKEFPRCLSYLVRTFFFFFLRLSI